MISLEPILETLRELFTSARKVVFSSKGSLLGGQSVFKNVCLVQDILALPDTCKGRVPEIAVNEVLKVSANKGISL